jgi:hypothetical protein
VTVGSNVRLVRARLVELDAAFRDPLPGGRDVEVQFNPETLKVTYQNKAQEQRSAGDQRGNSTRQVIGSGESKLTFQLWFDVSSPGAGGARDVRTLSAKVTYFMTPRTSKGAAPRGKGAKPTPPGVRFVWGTFSFDGLMDSLDETIDFFAPDGRPLRSTLSVGLSGQMEIVPPTGGGPGGAATGASLGATPGTRPLRAAPAGSSLPALAAAAGSGADWQPVALANGIENPRLLVPGRLLDLDPELTGRAGTL